jgi:hypothetical protein
MKGKAGLKMGGIFLEKLIGEALNVEIARCTRSSIVLLNHKKPPQQ